MAAVTQEELRAIVPEDITAGEDAVVKRLLRAAPEEAPLAKAGDEATIHYTGQLLDISKEADSSDEARGNLVEGSKFYPLRDIKKKFDSSLDRNAPFPFELGKGSVIRGFDAAVSSMRVGEKAVFDIRSDYAYGPSGAGPDIPPNSDLRFTIELLSSEPRRRGREEMEEAERLQVANNAKEEGNKFVKEGEFEKAENEYKYALSLLEDDSTAGVEPVENAVESVNPNIPACYSNLALCAIKQKKWYEARGYAEKAIKGMAKPNARVLFRAGVAANELQEFEKAKKYLEMAKDLSPEDAMIVKELAKCKAGMAKILKKEKQMYKGLFK